MKPRIWILTLLAGLLGTFYLYLFTDWVAPKRIQIIVQNRTALAQERGRRTSPLAFVLNGDYRLTHIRVVPLPAPGASTLKGPMWELISLSNSIPTHGFAYGQKVRGMNTDRAASRPEPLAPDTPYRLIVEAPHAKGEVDFRTPPVMN